MDSEIRALKCDSDISVDGDAYAAILAGLRGMDLNVAFFVFRNSSNSIAARTLQEGGTQTCPSLTLYLQHNEDVCKTGIDPHRGNWDDEWEQTVFVRDSVNSVLRQHDYGPDYVSEGTFVFLDTLERIVFDHIGRASKAAVHDLVCCETGGVKPAHVFWSSDGGLSHRHEEQEGLWASDRLREAQYRQRGARYSCEGRRGGILQGIRYAGRICVRRYEGASISSVWPVRAKEGMSGYGEGCCLLRTSARRRVRPLMKQLGRSEMKSTVAAAIVTVVFLCDQALADMAPPPYKNNANSPDGSVVVRVTPGKGGREWSA